MKSIGVVPPAEIDRCRILFMVMVLLLCVDRYIQVSPDFGGE